MLPSNVDPRRPDKVQRYVPKTTNAQEDLTPDYLNILGQHQTTANAVEAVDKYTESSASAEPNLQVHAPLEDAHTDETKSVAVTTNATNVIPTSPQYGVAIIPNNGVTVTAVTTQDHHLPPSETITLSTDTMTDTTAKPLDENKDLHSNPSKNDRFKVVKIASLEPFKRGRWKCMDFVDEAPPLTSQSKVTQSTGSIQMTGGYMQTQSLPQQQLQQMIIQSGFTNGTQFYPNMPAQIIPPSQYFYPQVTNMQNQNLQQQVPSSMPTQFINAAPGYFQTGVLQNAGFTMPQGYQNVQYVPTNIMQNPNSAFVPTSQTVQLTNFQQSQSYAGQPNITQSNVAQPLVNGHAFPQQNDSQVTAASLPTQTVKSVILNSNITQPVSQTVINQQNIQAASQNSAQSIPVIQNPQFIPNPNFQQQMQGGQNPNQLPVQVSVSMKHPGQQQGMIQVSQVIPIQSQSFDQSLASNVYTNPQFTSMSVSSLNVLENTDASADTVTEPSSIAEPVSESTDDPSKTNPVVNAIDNKIEQAMDLVKSHLMYTVREEVEVLKEKIAELMEKIQQLETENNYLKTQIPPKTQAPTPTFMTNPTQVSSSNPTPISQNNAPITNPSPNIIPNTQNPNSEAAPSH